MVGLENLPERLLSEERTRELLLLAQRGDEEAKETLVYYNLRLVLKIVHRFKDRTYEFDDLFQLGTIGLIHAIHKFDVSRGVKFSTYAVPLILGEIMRFLRDDSPFRVSRSIRKTAQQIKELEEEYRKEHGYRPSLNYVSSTLGLSTEEIVMALEGNKRPVSIHQRVETGSPDKDIYLFEQLADTSLSKEEILQRMDLKRVIGLLPERERKILYFRFFQDKTQDEIGEIMGLSQVQISRLERKILEKLRAHLKDSSVYLMETGET